MPQDNGFVFWICGLSGAGKSTVAAALVADLRQRSIPVLALDGDSVRGGLCAGLGFSDGDRAENLRRAAEVARLAADSGLCVVASFITPLESNRQRIREIVGIDRLALIFAAAPLDVCRRRDIKGLYAKAGAGLMPQMTGITSPFEQPETPDLVLDTATESPADSGMKLIDFSRERLGRLR